MRSGAEKLGWLRRALATGLLGLSGCPYGSELEAPERFAMRGGTGNAGGSGGGAGNPDDGIVIPGVVCDWQTAINKSCATSSCHGKGAAWGGLALDIDAGFVARLKDVPATLHDVVDCDPDATVFGCDVVQPGCTAFVGAKLVDSQNPEASFLLTKMRDSGCGNEMPLSPGNSASLGWDANRRACLESLWQGIAGLPAL
jgi:hypothetical protein